MVMLKKKTTSKASGGVKFKYTPRTAEQVKERASRQIGARDSYFNQDISFFTPPEKDSTVRILPPPPDNDWGHYGYEIAVHFEIGVDQSAYLCLDKMKGEACPICEERAEAVSQGETDLADALKPGFRTVLYVIDRSSEKKGPLLWNVSAGLDKDITKITSEPGTGEVLPVDDPVDGYDLSFVREGLRLKTKYKGIQFARKSSPLADEDEDAQAWLDFITEHPIDKQLVFHDYDYIKKVLNGQPPPKKETEEEVETPRTKKHLESGGPGAKKKAKDDPEPEKETTKGRPMLKKKAAEPEPEPAGDDDLPTWEELQELDDDAIVALAEAHDLEFPEEPFDDSDAVKVWIAEQLEIEEPAPAKEEKKPAAGGWRSKIKGK